MREKLSRVFVRDERCDGPLNIIDRFVLFLSSEIRLDRRLSRFRTCIIFAHVFASRVARGVSGSLNTALEGKNESFLNCYFIVPSAGALLAKRRQSPSRLKL